MMFFKILLFLFLTCQLTAAELDAPPVDVISNQQETEAVPHKDRPEASLYRKDRPPSSEAGIAAIVNRIPISVKDLKNKIKLVVKSNMDSLSVVEREQIKKQVLNILIDEVLKIDTTEKLGLKVDQKEMDETISHIEKQNNFSKGQFLKMLKQKGIPEQTFINSLKADLLWRQYISILAGSSLEVNKKELKEISDTYQATSTQYHLGEIEIYTPEGGSDEKSLEEMNKILNQLKGKKPFMAIAQSQSHAPSSARGGDIGWVDEEVLDSEEVEYIKNLSPGQVTMPIKTENGYKIILLIDKRENQGFAATLTARQIEISLSQDVVGNPKTLEAQIEKLTHLVKTVSNCSEFDQLVDQIPNAQIHIYKEVSLSDLSPDLRTVLSGLETGVPSQAIFNSSNNTIVFFLVCERNEVEATKVKSIEGMVTQVSNQRFISISEQKLREAKRVASIEIRI